ncbi:E1 ubiquitin-activating protein aos1 [Cystobasidiomycetes sp. EMM_F5]
MASEQTQKAPDHRSAETSSSAEAIKVSIKKNQSYVPFSRALQHTWAGTGSRKLKKLTPVVYAILVVWEYQSRNSGALPSEEDRASILRSIANEVLPKHGLDPKLLPQDLLQQFALTASMEFMPVCAIIGGLLGQDALNTLGGREAPITNLFTFDGSTSAGDFHRLSIDAE